MLRRQPPPSKGEGGSRLQRPAWAGVEPTVLGGTRPVGLGPGGKPPLGLPGAVETEPHCCSVVLESSSKASCTCVVQSAVCSERELGLVSAVPHSSGLWSGPTRHALRPGWQPLSTVVVP